MGWFTRRMIKKFIENPDSVLVVNPRFCEHIFDDTKCSICGIDKETFKKYPYKTWQEAYDSKNITQTIIYNKKTDMYGIALS
jgi:hypothetical protein